MSPGEARARFAAARVARLATADAAGSPHIVPIAFAVEGDTIYSAVDAKPKRTKALRRLANVRANPAVSLLVDHWDEDDWGEAGGRGPTAAAASSPPMTPRRAGPWSCSASATRASRRPARCSRSRSSAGAAGRDRPKAIERRARSPGRP